MNPFETVVSMILGLSCLVQSGLVLAGDQDDQKKFKVVLTVLIVEVMILALWLYSVTYYHWYEPSFWK